MGGFFGRVEKHLAAPGTPSFQPASGTRIYPGQEIGLLSIASAATTIKCRGVIQLDSGRPIPFAFQHVSNSDRTTALTVYTPHLNESGTITQMTATKLSAAALKRGVCYLQAVVGAQGIEEESALVDDILFADYIYDLHAPRLGHYVDPGPGGGEGNLLTVALAADTPGSTDLASSALIAANALRRLIAVSVRYNASADAATRTIVVTIRAPHNFTSPTGYGATTTINTYTSPTLTLTASEEGLIQIEDGYVVVNDNGTLTVASEDSAPNPLPLWITEDDDTGLIVTMGTGHANDRYNADALVEEWLVL